MEANPLKGFVDLFSPSNNFPQSIGASLFGLDEVMIGMDNFDWTVIDAFLAQEAAKGNHSYIQVNIDPANGNTDMPAFLIGQVASRIIPETLAIISRLICVPTGTTQT